MCNICARCSKTMLVFWEILLSLSARRVWIEIELDIDYVPGIARHSLRGGCGLKYDTQTKNTAGETSLSARRM